MKIEALFRILREIKYVKSVLKCYGDSLMCGRYYQHNSFRALSLDKTSTREKATLYFDKNGRGRITKSIVKFLNFISYFRNNNKKSTQEYEGLYIANNYDKVREIKLFSFKSDKILTICTSKEEASKQIEQYDTFGKAYNMPRVKRNDKYETSFEISMVNLKPYVSESLALENICRSTVESNPIVNKLDKQCTKKLATFSFDDEMNSYFKKIVDRIDPSLMDIQMPICLQHGDLSRENLIFGESEGKTDFWWIDWEHAGERIFFYDYFFYIVNSALYYDMDSFECYINGEADEALEKMFSHFGLSFDKNKRFDYLLIFMIPFLIERVCSVGGLPVLKRYYELIEKMEACVK